MDNDSTTIANMTEAKENTMTDKPKTKPTKPKTKPSKPKAKPTEGEVELDQLERLDRGQTRSVQETFRCTPEEHNDLVALARKDKFKSMSDFFRTRLGLDA